MRSLVRNLLNRILAGVFAAGLAFVASASAQTRGVTVDQFLAKPNEMLQQFPDGGAQLISLIRDTAVGHPEALQTILGLLRTANSEQQMAFGSGLGQAAQIVVRTNQNYANQIQQAIADSGSENARTAFAAVTGNVTIAATGGGGGGGGVGGPTGSFGIAFGGTNSGSSQSFGGLHYQTASQNFFTGSGSGVSGSSNAASRSVSPR